MTVLTPRQSSEVQRFLNFYECPCGETWQDTWTAICDDDCPTCRTTCSPVDTKDLPSR